ncbi:RDD family protein [Chryseobacterium sp.]|uniref:RDD family protein n=1 Tax=Chryseobacterium sp. TaxID=1871047 RepID=UPI0025C4D950|nr:RDD family protein [Chryseobacterium sp.]
MSQIAINTSQNVNINFTTASVGERMLAFIIDLLIKAAYVFIIFYMFFGILDLGYLLNGLDQWSQMAIYIAITFPIHIYSLVLESLMEGQTPGKKIMKIRVVKIDGYQASFGDYMIRWIFRLIDILMMGGLIGLITMIVSKNNQRLGDIASGTAVISLKNSINISHTILENIHEDYIPLFPQVIALSDNDMRIIKDNYTKALRIDDRQIITKLSDKIKNILKLEIDPTKMTERQFIGVIIKDYNYYTGKDN